MKKILGLLLCGALGMQAQAQQLPNGDMSQWKAKGESGASYASFGGSMVKRPGVEPQSWNSGNVSQFGFVNIENLCVKGGDEESQESYAVLANRFVGLGTIGSPAPGFINLGTPWVFATMTMLDEEAKKLGDGGAYGGMKFTYRPDAVRCKVKKTAVDGEKSHIIAYLWNGTFLSQAPADIAQAEKDGPWSVSKLAVLQDVDRAVMGRESEERMIQKGNLIASCDYELTEDIAEWKTVTVPLEYKNGMTPSKINVIVAAGDYWTRGNLNIGSELSVDDIELLYYTNLSAININGVPLADFNAETLEYTVDAAYNSMTFEPVAAGAGATVETVYNAEEKKATITVKGGDIEVNPENVTVYTVTFTSEPVSAFLPNGDFTEWKAEGESGSSLNTTEPDKERLRPGIEPSSWNSGNVNQLGLAKNGNLCVKSETEEDGVYVTLTNQRVEVLGMGATAPGFITLAEPWIFATSAMTSAAAQAYADGGSYGGQSFANTPDAVQCKIKRTAVESEKAHIVAYLWNGTFVSKVPNKLDRSGNVFSGYKYSIGGYADMNDVDRVVIGRETNEDLMVSKGTLVASCDYELTEDIAEWTTVSVPLDYKSDEMPTKMNIIISAGDYWNRTALQTGSTLSVDDVQFVYWTHLTDLTVDGATVAGFASDVHEYTVEAPLTPATAIAAQVAGRTAKTDVQIDYIQAVATVTVKAADFDENPDNVTVYTLRFQKQAPALKALACGGKAIELIDGQYDYTVEEYYDNTEVTYEAAEGCTIGSLPAFDMATRKVTFIVCGANIAYDPNDYVTYTITFGEYPYALTKLEWKGEPVADFAADKLAYVVDDYYTGYSDIAYEAEGASVSRKWDAATQTFTLTVKAKDAAIYPEHQAVYTVRCGQMLVQTGTSFPKNLEGTFDAVVDLTLKAGWNVLCLPFDVTATDLIEGAKVTQLSQYGAEYGLVFTPVEGNRMQAFVPYLVYSPEVRADQPVVVKDVTFVPGSGSVVKPENSIVSFVGKTVSYGGTGLYTLSDEGAAEKIAGTLVSDGEDVRTSISALSGYFQFDEGAEIGSLTVNIDLANAVDKVEAADGKFTVVTLSGVTLLRSADSLDGLKPGVYVINGKVTAVK